MFKYNGDCMDTINQLNCFCCNIIELPNTKHYKIKVVICVSTKKMFIIYI